MPGRRNAADTILQAARTCLIAGGGEFEMADVAREAGVSEGLAYRYHGTKAGLVAAVVADFYARYAAVANAEIAGPSWARRERRRLGAVIDHLYADPLTPIVLGAMARSGAVAAAEAEHVASIAALAARNIAAGQDAGEVGSRVDPALAGAAVTGAIRQALAEAFREPGRLKPKTLADAIWALITRGLQLDPNLGEDSPQK